MPALKHLYAPFIQIYEDVTEDTKKAVGAVRRWIVQRIVGEGPDSAIQKFLHDFPDLQDIAGHDLENSPYRNSVHLFESCIQIYEDALEDSKKVVGAVRRWIVQRIVGEGTDPATRTLLRDFPDLPIVAKHDLGNGSYRNSVLSEFAHRLSTIKLTIFIYGGLTTGFLFSAVAKPLETLCDLCGVASNVIITYGSALRENVHARIAKIIGFSINGLHLYFKTLVTANPDVIASNKTLYERTLAFVVALGITEVIPEKYIKFRTLPSFISIGLAWWLTQPAGYLLQVPWISALTGSVASSLSNHLSRITRAITLFLTTPAICGFYIYSHTYINAAFALPAIFTLGRSILKYDVPLFDANGDRLKKRQRVWAYVRTLNPRMRPWEHYTFPRTFIDLVGEPLLSVVKSNPGVLAKPCFNNVPPCIFEMLARTQLLNKKKQRPSREDLHVLIEGFKFLKNEWHFSPEDCQGVLKYLTGAGRDTLSPLGMLRALFLVQMIRHLEKGGAIVSPSFGNKIKTRKVILGEKQDVFSWVTDTFSSNLTSEASQDIFSSTLHDGMKEGEEWEEGLIHNVSFERALFHWIRQIEKEVYVQAYSISTASFKQMEQAYLLCQQRLATPHIVGQKTGSCSTRPLARNAYDAAESYLAHKAEDDARLPVGLPKAGSDDMRIAHKILAKCAPTPPNTQRLVVGLPVRVQCAPHRIDEPRRPPQRFPSFVHYARRHYP